MTAGGEFDGSASPFPLPKAPWSVTPRQGLCQNWRLTLTSGILSHKIGRNQAAICSLHLPASTGQRFRLHRRRPESRRGWGFDANISQAKPSWHRNPPPRPHSIRLRLPAEGRSQHLERDRARHACRSENTSQPKREGMWNAGGSRSVGDQHEYSSFSPRSMR